MNKPELYVKNEVPASLALVALITASGAANAQIDQYQYIEPNSCANTKINFTVPNYVDETELVVKSVENGKYDIRIGDAADCKSGFTKVTKEITNNFDSDKENRLEPKI